MRTSHSQLSIWVLGTRTQVIVVVWQVLYALSDLLNDNILCFSYMGIFIKYYWVLSEAYH